MNAVLVAMVVLSWVAIVLLALGYAGLVAQVKALQSRGVAETPTTVFAEFAGGAPGTRTVALTLTSTCGTCEEVFEVWPELSRRLIEAGHRPVLISIDNSPVWADRGATNLHLAADLSAPLLLAYQPALVQFDAAGTLISAEPLGSADGLREAIQSQLIPSVPADR